MPKSPNPTNEKASISKPVTIRELQQVSLKEMSKAWRTFDSKDKAGVMKHIRQDSKFRLDSGCAELGLPMRTISPVPNNIQQQLIGKVLKPGMPVVIDKKDYVVVNFQWNLKNPTSITERVNALPSLMALAIIHHPSPGKVISRQVMFTELTVVSAERVSDAPRLDPRKQSLGSAQAWAESAIEHPLADKVLHDRTFRLTHRVIIEQLAQGKSMTELAQKYFVDRGRIQSTFTAAQKRFISLLREKIALEKIL